MDFLPDLSVRRPCSQPECSVHTSPSHRTFLPSSSDLTSFPHLTKQQTFFDQLSREHTNSCPQKFPAFLWVGHTRKSCFSSLPQPSHRSCLFLPFFIAAPVPYYRRAIDRNSFSFNPSNDKQSISLPLKKKYFFPSTSPASGPISMYCVGRGLFRFFFFLPISGREVWTNN